MSAGNNGSLVALPRAVVEQALEAFNVATTPLARDRQEVLKAMEALRAALEQPQGEQEPDWRDLYQKQKRRAEMWIAKYEKDIGKLEVAVPVAVQPQGDQEPVAWMDAETRVMYDHDTSEVDQRLGFKPTVPLCTHPQPRQPLTDEQWLKLWTGKTGQRLRPGPDRDRLLRRFRFAERAHGIGL